VTLGGRPAVVPMVHQSANAEHHSMARDLATGYNIPRGRTAQDIARKDRGDFESGKGLAACEEGIDEGAQVHVVAGDRPGLDFHDLPGGRLAAGGVEAVQPGDG
jgi:hypothetical protein